MNIQQAILQLERAIRAYTARTSDGRWLIPIQAQRPIYLEGPPGVGKTAIMVQLAQRMQIGLVSYTMTHHTRQSALGLPMIEKQVFGGQEYSATEYTMSEIIAEVYRCMEASGASAGILFLDEINCVSETLMPAMLELLQHKRFGRHRLPEGWVIVCAGNPVQYNRNARTLDAVTLDRVRLMRIEPDVNAWQAFAAQTGVHPSIRAYLRLRPEDFYIAEDENIVTPRSWCDLSDMIHALCAAGEAPDRLLFEQYLQCESICERFSLYYAMCENVSRSFQLDKLLFEGDLSSAAHFSSAPFDEALCCAEMLAQRAQQMHQAAEAAKNRAARLEYFLEAARRESNGADFHQSCQALLERREHALKVRKSVGAISPEEEAQENALHSLIRSTIAAILSGADPDAIRKAQAEAASQAEGSYLSAKQNIEAFAKSAFAGESFQAVLCRDILKI